jgi:hypothetical protein
MSSEARDFFAGYASELVVNCRRQLRDLGGVGWSDVSLGKCGLSCVTAGNDPDRAERDRNRLEASFV